jgi:hypothetical protein
MSLPTRTRPLLADRYRLQDRIAAGGFGEVWQGTDTVLDRPVAVKLLQAGYAQHPEALSRFRLEARHAGAVSHDGIAHIYDYGEPDPPQPPFLVMELVDGPSLAGVLTSGPLSPGQTMDVVAQAAAGLAAAHRAGLVHRDIKPGNLLIGRDGVVKITDFGIAHAAGSAPVTGTGILVGTAAYLAPERAAGGRGTPASDLYSLGIVAYHCLTGDPPFAGSLIEVALAHCHQPLPDLSGMPPGVVALVRQLTAKDPAARPPGAEEVAARAGQLRDQLLAGEAGPAAVGEDSLVGRAAVPPQAAAYACPATSEEGQLAQGLSLSDWLRRAGRRWGALLTAAVAALALAGVTLAGMTLSGTSLASKTSTVPPHHLVGPSPSPPQPRVAAARPVTVHPRALAGRPVSAVRRQLAHQGLKVFVRWRPSGQRTAGTVLSVWPGGQLPDGSLIIVTGAKKKPAGFSLRTSHTRSGATGRDTGNSGSTAQANGGSHGNNGNGKGKGNGNGKGNGGGNGKGKGKGHGGDGGGGDD